MPEPLTADVSEVTPASIMSILDAPEEAQTKADQPPEEVVAPPPTEPPKSVEEPKPPAEAPKEPPAPPPQPEGEFDAETGPPRVALDDKGKEEWHWAKERAQAIYGGYKDAKAYREVAPT